MHRLVESLQNTTKRNEKLKILEEYKENEKVKDLLFLTYNPLMQYFVKKIWKPEKTGKFSLLEQYDEVIQLLYDLNKRRITGYDALQKIKDFMETLNEPSQKIFELVLKKDLKCGINVKSINKIWPDLLPEEDFQLAEKYNPEKDYGVDYWYYSPKLDGIRCRIHRDNLIPLGRNGKEIGNCELIVPYTKQIIQYFDLIFLDGEIYIPGKSFNEIMSIISKYKFKDEDEKSEFLKSKVSQLEYHIFAAYSNEIKNTKDMIDLLREIKNFIHVKSLFNISIISQSKIKNDYREIMDKTEQMVKSGYEGIMLRHPEIHYEFKRSNSLLKVKPIFEADLKVTDVEVGYITMYKHDKPIQVETVTAIYVEGYAEDNKRKEYIYTKVGSGFTFEDRKDIYENIDKYVGKIVEIEFQEISKNKDDKSKWSLRFPVFKRWRFDKGGI